MSTDWWIDEGIGEHRAARIVAGEIVEALIDRQDGRLRLGQIVRAKLGVRVGAGAWLATDRGDAILEAVPPGFSQGRTLAVEIVREAIPEAGRAKPPRARAVDAGERPAPTLADRLPGARRVPVFGDDPIEAAGWSELIEQAASGEIGFPGGALRLSPTPAMALFDVDGTLAPAELSIAGARAAAAAVLRLGIGGSIGIDLPSVGSKAVRDAAAAAIDAILPRPFERTAVNGFGFVQVVRPRPRASIPEIVRADPALSAAIALVQTGGRGHGARRLVAAPAVIARIEPAWIDALAARVGGAVGLRADPGLAISAGHVEPA